MKTLTDSQLRELAGEYHAPEGIYQLVKSLPFLGDVKCNVDSLTAGQWTEITIEYTVGGSGLADGAWIKGAFKFYTDWALFQTTDPTRGNYVSAEYMPGPLLPGQDPATVQELHVRFDQKGHERPFQKAVIVDVVDGYLNPGDRIVIRLGDRRGGGRGTRVQTFVEKTFLMRWYIDPIGTSRFAAIKPDIAIPIVAGPIHHLKVATPRLCRPGIPWPLHAHAEDVWGNTTHDVEGVEAKLQIFPDSDGATENSILSRQLTVSPCGWTYANFESLSIAQEGDYRILTRFSQTSTQRAWSTVEYISIDSHSPAPRALFADLHVHSDDTVGTNDSAYNFSYAQLIAGLDIVGYTANDFNVTATAWSSTLGLINQLNQANVGKLLIFPGTEWCGNSAVGGDHNVVFLDDPVRSPPQFPVDKHGNLARSFEWNAEMSNDAQLVPGAWPLDEVYAIYALDAENHLMIPHVGGRRCNLAWHHPRLDRLVEIGSAWGHFEWLIKDSLQRGWKTGVSANSDEHRGRCGGGVPGTAVFGTRGGLTGVLCDELGRQPVGQALRARRTFATSGERLVGLLKTKDGTALQGDEIEIERGEPLTLTYEVFGASGFSSIEAFDGSGRFFQRNLWYDQVDQDGIQGSVLRVTWGGARVYDRYREAVWEGVVSVEGQQSRIQYVQPFGGIAHVPEDQITRLDDQTVTFRTRTSGDADGMNLRFYQDNFPSFVRINSRLGGYVKVGNVLDQNPHKPCPQVTLVAEWGELSVPGGKLLEIPGGADLFIRIELVPDVELPRRVHGELQLDGALEGSERAVFIVGREWDGGKVVTSPIFVKSL